jgi:hypothetical protein
MAGNAEFWIGKRRPDHMTAAQYEAMTARCTSSDRAFYVHLLEILEASGCFAKTEPQHCPDISAMLARLEISLDQIVGLGVETYDPATTTRRSGAITEAKTHHSASAGPVRIVVTYEDGSIEHLHNTSFSDNPGARLRHRLDLRQHGAPYLAQLAAAVACRNASETSAKQQAQATRARLVAQLAEENPALMTPNIAQQIGRKISRHAMAALNIRTMLKAAFPGVKFSVKSDSYSMGDSIHIRWTDGPTAAQVDAIADKFSAGRFNGMEDIYEPSDSAWTDLFGSSKYIFTNRDLSDDAVTSLLVAIYPDESSRPSAADYRAGRIRDDFGRDRVYMASKDWTPTKAKA